MKRAVAIGLAAVTVISAAFSATAPGDEDDGIFRFPWSDRARPGVAAVENTAYREECGSCHMAYPPGLLPAQSWERLMATLEDHFGENAELAEDERTAILNYLLDGAAGRSDYRLGSKMLRGMKGTPLRITELPYFRHEHGEIPERLVAGNPQVRSFGNCDACHAQADRGSFDEHQVTIPGYGRYDD